MAGQTKAGQDLQSQDGYIGQVECAERGRSNPLSMIYILITGTKIKAFNSLRRLCKSIGVDHSFIKDNLPFESGPLKIQEVELDEKLF